MREKEHDKQKKAEEKKAEQQRTKEARAAAAAEKKALDVARRQVAQLCLKVLTKIVAVKAKMSRALVDKGIGLVEKNLKQEATELKKQLEEVEAIAEAHATGEPVNEHERAKLEGYTQLVKVTESTYKMIMDAIKAEQ